MPYEEFLKWNSYFRDRPVGFREDNRTYMLLRAQGIKANPEDLFPTIRAIKMAEEISKTPNQAIPKGKFLERMLAARNGDGSTLNIGAKNDKFGSN